MSPDKLEQDLTVHFADEFRAGHISRGELLKRASVLGLSLTSIGALLGRADIARASVPAAVRGRRGGTIRVALTPVAAALDPIMLQDDGAFVTLQQVYEYLAWVEADGRLRPMLATSWKPNHNATAWTFNLRTNARWSDGRPFTADDVVYTFNLLADPKVGSDALPYFAGIFRKGNIEKVNSHTVVFHLDRPFADFPYFVGAPNFNAFVLPNHYDHTKNLSHPIGTGPFVLTNYVPGQSATFRRNPHYWQNGAPLLDGVRIQYMSETQAQVLALQSGSVDMMTTTPFQGSQALFSNPAVKILTARSSTFREVHMRVDKAPFTDKRVRQALAYCLDRPKIRQILFNGRGDLGNDHLWAPYFGYPVAVPQRRQDYAKAKELLAAAGYSRGLKVTLTTENYLEIPQYVAILKQMAKPAGIDIAINAESQTAFYGSGANQPWIDVPFGCVDWSSRAVPSQLNDLVTVSKARWNNSRWSNHVNDRLARQFDATLDHGRRLHIATQMASLIHDATPMIVGYWIDVPRAIRKNVHGTSPSGFDFLDLKKAYLS